jgi:hypothetical protein
VARNGRQVAVSDSFTDLRVQMKQFVEARATHEEHHGDTPEQIWAATVKHFREIAGQNFTGMTKAEVKKLVYNSRKRVNGGDAISKIEQMYGGDENKAFLCYQSSFVDKKGMQKMTCFALRQLLSLLMHPLVSAKCFQVIILQRVHQAIFTAHRFNCMWMPPFVFLSSFMPSNHGV